MKFISSFSPQYIYQAASYPIYLPGLEDVELQRIKVKTQQEREREKLNEAMIQAEGEEEDQEEENYMNISSNR